MLQSSLKYGYAGQRWDERLTGAREMDDQSERRMTETEYSRKIKQRTWEWY